MSNLYIIKAVGTGLVKIGFSTNVPKRLKSLQTASPYRLEVLATWAGTDADEKALHLKFAEYRKTGEWFKAGDWLNRLLEDVKPQSRKGRETFSRFDESRGRVWLDSSKSKTVEYIDIRERWVKDGKTCSLYVCTVKAEDRKTAMRQIVEKSLHPLPAPCPQQSLTAASDYLLLAMEW